MAKEMNCEDLWGKWLRPPSQEPPGKWPHVNAREGVDMGTHCVQIMKLVVISNLNFFSNSKRISKSVFDHFCFNYCIILDFHVGCITYGLSFFPTFLDCELLGVCQLGWNILIGAGHAWSQGKKHGSNKMLQVQRQPKLTRKSLKV